MLSVEERPALSGMSMGLPHDATHFRRMMNGRDIKKAAISKAKQAASTANNAANGNGNKKRWKGEI